MLRCPLLMISKYISTRFRISRSYRTMHLIECAGIFFRIAFCQQRIPVSLIKRTNHVDFVNRNAVTTEYLTTQIIAMKDSDLHFVLLIQILHTREEHPVPKRRAVNSYYVSRLLTGE